MRLTTRQIAAVLGRSEITAWRQVRAWQARGVAVESTHTGRRPTLTVGVADVAFCAGLCVEDVLALAGVEGAA